MSRFAAALMFSLLAAAPAMAQAQELPNPQVPTVVTTGDAVIRRAPDQAFISLAVETRAKSPRDAQRQNAEAMTAVQQKLADAGLPKEAIRTTGYSINQEFDFVNGRRVPREYVAHNGLEVRVEPVERTGEILDVAVAAGTTSVQGVRFDLKDRVSVERDALRHAVEDARARADALASGAGRTVDRVLRIDDSRQARPYEPVPVMAMARSADAATTPIDPGVVEVRAHVTLTVSLKQP
jgi:uncharacterized protein YggE